LLSLVSIAIASPRQQLTWRLFITLECGMKSYPATPAALRAAIEQKFQIPLTGSKLVLARERDRYCATLSLQTATASFVDGRTFSLEIDFSPSEKISAMYHNLKTYVGSGRPNTLI
jgi:hypothetical protein